MTMKLIVIAVLLVVAMASVGAYAATITGTTKTLGGTGSVTVTSPTSAATVAWTINASGLVTTANVTWTPAASLNYTIRVVVGASTGTAAIVSSGTSSRTDPVTISPSVAADAVTAATVVISQD
jgi:hypothetical protein